uniref:NADH-ubiquinone oxidoreductase chain 1 n=1 Tax=Polychaeta sp. TaxID=3061522 RepID=A0AAU8L2M0_9ANNE
MLLQPYIMVLINFIMALLAMAFYTLLERKILGYIQLRKGPNKVSLSGIPQPLADAMKLFTKEPTTPTISNFAAFAMSPMLTLMLILIMWSLYPLQSPSYFFMFGILLFLCISSLNVYTTLGSGWSSNSKYALLGAIRSVAQTISYEVSMAMILLAILCPMQSFDLNFILSTQYTPNILINTPLFFMWFITCLAETNRAPFDFVEGESELVSGFNVEFSGGGFALLFMAEYASIIFMSAISSCIFLSMMMPAPMWIMLFPLTTTLIGALFIWVRGAMPRMRYDRLMMLTWKTLLPLSITILMLNTMIMMNNA